jgi:hypothetical protein
VSAKTQATLRALSGETGLTMQEIVAEAVEQYRRQRNLELTNQAYAEIRSDSDAWAAEVSERRAWETTLADGIEAGAVIADRLRATHERHG